MAKNNPSKRKTPPELVDHSNTILQNLGIVSPLYSYQDPTVESLQLGNQAGINPLDIPDEYSPPPLLLLPVTNPYSQETATFDTTTLDIPTNESSTLPVLRLPTVHQRLSYG